MANLPLCKYRYALFVSYFGTRYQGSQRLILRGTNGDENTIQEAIEAGLESFLVAKRCRLTAASRTDKGVHAFMNTFTLPLMDYGMPTEVLKSRLNKYLARKGHDILVNEVVLTPAAFHPRCSVTSREYIYRIAVPDKHKTIGFKLDHRYPDLLGLLPLTELHRVSTVPTIDFDKAQKVMDLMNGRHDFASFTTTLNESSKGTVRTIDMDLVPEEPNTIHPDQHRICPLQFYRFYVKSEAFMHNQVRRMIGAILSYATYDKVKFREIERLLQNPHPSTWDGKCLIADACGLYLNKMTFSKELFDGTIKTYEDHSEELVTNIYTGENVIADKSDDVDDDEDDKRAGAQNTD